jgi:hypothetical protein
LKHAGPARPGRINSIKTNQSAIDRDHRFGLAAERRYSVVDNTENIVFDEDDSQMNWYGWAIYPSRIGGDKIQGRAIRDSKSGGRPFEKRKPGRR